MVKAPSLFLIWFVFFFLTATGKTLPGSSLHFFAADDPLIQYFGRVDFTNPLRPRFWQPGTYLDARFQGTSCGFIVGDQMQGDNHNYLEIEVDDTLLYRLKLQRSTDTILVVKGLGDGPHKILICKSTETICGWLQFEGFLCRKLLSPPERPRRKMEFIGNSITCGARSDTREFSCTEGQWFDESNAYQSYGPITARTLGAQWVISAYSGIGLIHSCCGIPITMPEIYGKTDQHNLDWDFSRYQPDVITICLGQNDGIQDSTLFCGAYVNFIHQVRTANPHAVIICLSSPMADSILAPVLKRYITGVVRFLQASGEKDIHSFFFSKRYYHSCYDHPNLEEHKEIAAELSPFIRSIMDW